MLGAYNCRWCKKVIRSFTCDCEKTIKWESVSERSERKKREINRKQAKLRKQNKNENNK